MGELDDLWDFENPDASEGRFRQRIASLDPATDAMELAEAQTQLARAQGLQRHFDDAHATLDQVEARLADLSQRVWIRYDLERGRVFNSSGALERAQPLFLLAWDEARAVSEDALAVDAAHMLGIVTTGEESLSWNLRALQLAQTSDQPRAQRWQGSLYNNIGWTYFGEGRYHDALAMFERALERRQADGKEGQIGVARWCIARTLRGLGRTEEALALQQSLLAALPEDGYVSEEIGECLLALGRGAESRPYFRRAAEMLSQDIWLAAQEPQRLERLRQLGADK